MTTKKTNRVKSTGLDNRLDFECTVDRISYVQTELRQLEAERDAAVQHAQQMHAFFIAELQAELKAKAALCEKFAEEHRTDLLPGPAKSNETPLSRYGFRLGNRTVVLLNKKCSWLAAIKLLKAFGYDSCVRQVEEVNKEAVLSSTDEKGFIGEGPVDKRKNITALANIGLRIKQVEAFFIEPKVDGSEPVRAEQ